MRWLAMAVLASLAQEEKVDLGYRFEKGQQVQLRLKYALNVKLDSIPEAFQGVVSENPVDLKLEGVVRAEVKEFVDGRATLEGRWRTLKARGNMVLEEVDLDYDADKKPEKKPEPGAEGFGNLQDNLKRLAVEPMTLTVERSGKLAVKTGAGKDVNAVAAPALAFNGLMGPLPGEKVARGGTWKGEQKLALPGPAGTLALAIRSENTYEADEKVEGRDCARIRSKLSVSDSPEAQQLPGFKMKTAGEGEGRTWFDLKAGGAAKSAGSLKVRVTASVADPGGGETIEIKATLKIDQSHELTR